MDATPERFIATTAASPIDGALLQRFEQVTGHAPHRLLRRGLAFSHRRLHVILDRCERGQPFYLFTGRGPSSDSLHLGHALPFELTKWLQDVFNAPLLLMLTDDMKLLHSKKLASADVKRYGIENSKDMLAFGFDSNLTFLFSNLNFVGGAFYENIISVARHIAVKDIKTALGFSDQDNVGMFYCSATQSAGTFASSFPNILGTDPEALQAMPCLIPCSYDIDGYFSELRKHANELGVAEPAFLYSDLLPALQGGHRKMSASVSVSAIYLSDSPAIAREKLITAKHTFDAASILRFLTFFMEDDNELARISKLCEANRMDINELVEVLIETVQHLLIRFQESRATITDEYLQRFMTPRLLLK